MHESQETQVQSLGWDDPLEEGMATHSSIFSGKPHGQMSPAGYGPWGCKKLDTAEATECAHTHALWSEHYLKSFPGMRSLFLQHMRNSG